MKDVSNNKPLMCLKDISKNFGHVMALNKVDFEVYDNEILALVGDNGAGKSTLIKILSGLLMPDNGKIFFDNKEVKIRSTRDSQSLGIGTVYQNLNLVDCTNVAQNLFLGIEPGRFGFIDRKKMKTESAKVIDSLKIDIKSTDLTVGYLSGGQRQALAIGRVLLRESRLILLDEPTAAMGVQETGKIIELIKALKKDGKTIIIISHNIEQVFSIADRIFVLKQGTKSGSRLVKKTTKEEIIGMITGIISD